MLLVILMMRIIFHIIFFLSNTQVLRLRKAFASNSSESGLLLNGVRETKNEAKEQNGGFLCMLLATYVLV